MTIREQYINELKLHKDYVEESVDNARTIYPKGHPDISDLVDHSYKIYNKINCALIDFKDKDIKILKLREMMFEINEDLKYFYEKAGTIRDFNIAEPKESDIIEDAGTVSMATALGQELQGTGSAIKSKVYLFILIILGLILTPIFPLIGICMIVISVIYAVLKSNRRKLEKVNSNMEFNNNINNVKEQELAKFRELNKK